MTRKTRITRRTFSTSALAAAAALGMPHVARAQAYPSRPVRMILPFAAGGVADATSRLAADKLGEKLGQRFVVENMPGPGGIAAGARDDHRRARRLYARSHHQRHRDQRRRSTSSSRSTR